MSDVSADAERRAERLSRWYPRAWRSRYGDEFKELLIADIVERPRSWRRTLDIVRRGLATRLALGGLAYHAEPYDRARAGLASLVCAIGLFLLVGASMWSQLTIGWQWSPPDASATIFAVLVMSGSIVVIAALAALALLPFAWALLVRCARARLGGVAAPMTLAGAGASIVVWGGLHFARGWPGTGGHPWAHQHLLPGGLASFAWASTLSITSYWAHPAALLAFPTHELAWMVVSPAAMLSMIVGGMRTIRRLELSARALRFEGVLARLACVAMLCFLIGPACWLTVGGSGPRGLFHAGVIDLVDAGAMVAALAAARLASRQLGASSGLLPR